MGLIGTSRQNKMKNAPWLKISLLVEIGTVMLRWLHLNPSKIHLDCKHHDPSQF